MTAGKGRCVTIVNKNGRTTNYQLVSYVDPAGNIQQLLLTEREVSASSSRASKNIDCLTPTGFFDSILAFFLRLL